MKRETPSLYAALLVGVLVNVLLRSQTAYWCRAGAAAALLCAPLLAGVRALFAVCWRQGATPLLRLLFAVLLAGTTVLELLRLWGLAQRLYPGAITQLALCLLVLLPILYLRRVSAISQTAYVVLCLLVVATVGMLLSVLPRLAVTNLQVRSLTSADLADAARDQLTLYPEYLLPALWPEPEKRGRHTLLRLAGAALGFDVAIHLMLELFYGAAMPLRADPLHAAARCGVLSVFNRMEWLQLILWVMAVTVKLALYLYAMTRLLGSESRQENAAANLGPFGVYLLLVPAACLLLRGLDVDTALRWRSAFTWGFAILVWIGGAAAWLCKKCRRCS